MPRRRLKARTAAWHSWYRAKVVGFTALFRRNPWPPATVGSRAAARRRRLCPAVSGVHTLQDAKLVAEAAAAPLPDGGLPAEPLAGWERRELHWPGGRPRRPRGCQTPLPPAREPRFVGAAPRLP
eukprot:4492025-Lingulodinium_polyedra.AAC.1